MNKENQRVLLQHVLAENHHDIEATLATLHPECLFIDQPLGLRFEGHHGARAHYHMWWKALDVRTDDGSVLHGVNDDLLIADSAFVGRHRGDFAGVIAPTNNPFRMPFVVFVEFKDQLLYSERFVYDLNGLLEQLGQPSFDIKRIAAANG